jgi:hypothetical protein
MTPKLTSCPICKEPWPRGSEEYQLQECSNIDCPGTAEIELNLEE